MDTLPPEIISHICVLAVTAVDSGFDTVNHLRLVSKYFYNITLPLKFNSLIVHEIGDLQKILNTLAAVNSPFRRVRNLFLSTYDRTENRPLASADTLKAFNRLLTFCAPTLHNFTILASPKHLGTAILAQLFRTKFPVLEELSIHGMYPYPSPPSSPLASRDRNISDAPVQQTIRFPRLERLHLSGNPNPDGILLSSCMPVAFPSLTHLRFSKIGDHAVRFLRDLKEQLRLSQQGEADEGCDEVCSDGKSVSRRLPKNLRVLEIQLGQDISMTRQGQETSRTILDQIRTEKMRTVQIFSHPPPHRGELDAEFIERTKKEWLGRLNGKQGCWSAS